MRTGAVGDERKAGRWRQVRRFLPLVLLVLAIVLVFATGLDHALSLDALDANRARLLALVQAHPFASGLGFLLLYAIATALSIPGGTILTLAGGFLFGTLLATVLVVAGATIGAVAVFLIARTSLGEPLRAKAGPWLARMEAGFRESAMSYMLVLRLVPIFPFWLVNLVPAFLGVRLSTYTLATCLGIVPGVLVYASVGNGLGAIFDMGGKPNLGIIFQPAVLLPLLGLAVLALVPVAYRRLRRRRAGPPAA
jgi:uncharacterized membrane protein YdjX (TVP38/TMEM64 family)